MKLITAALGIAAVYHGAKVLKETIRAQHEIDAINAETKAENEAIFYAGAKVRENLAQGKYGDFGSVAMQNDFAYYKTIHRMTHN